MHARLMEKAERMEDIGLRMKPQLVKLKAHELDVERIPTAREETYYPPRLEETQRKAFATFQKTRAEVGIPIAAEVLGGIATAGELVAHPTRVAAHAIEREGKVIWHYPKMNFVEPKLGKAGLKKPGPKLGKAVLKKPEPLFRMTPIITTKPERVRAWGELGRLGGELLVTATIAKAVTAPIKALTTKISLKALKVKPTKIKVGLKVKEKVAEARIRSIGIVEKKGLIKTKKYPFSIEAKGTIVKTQKSALEPIERTLKKVVDGFQHQPIVEKTIPKGTFAPRTIRLIGKGKIVTGSKAKIVGKRVIAPTGKVKRFDFGTTSVAKPIKIYDRVEIISPRGTRLFETRTGVSATYTGKEIGIGKAYQKTKLFTRPTPKSYRFGGYSDIAAYKRMLSYGGEKTKIGLVGKAKIKGVQVVKETGKFYKVIKPKKKLKIIRLPPLKVQTQAQKTITIEKQLSQLVQEVHKPVAKQVAKETTQAYVVKPKPIWSLSLGKQELVPIDYTIPAQPQYSYMLSQQYKLPQVYKAPTMPALTAPLKGVSQIQLKKVGLKGITLGTLKMVALEKQLQEKTKRQLKMPAIAMTHAVATAKLQKQLKKQATKQAKAVQYATAMMTQTAQAKATGTATALKFKTPTITWQKMARPTPYVPIDFQITVPPPPPPFFWLPPRKKKPKLRFKKKKKPKEGWLVFGRRRGKFVAVSTKPVTKLKALGIGAKWADITAGATFKIMPAGKPAYKTKLDFAWLKLAPKFYAKDKHTFIEKTKHRISTIGEKEEITYKGLEAIKFKSLFGGEKSMARKRRKKRTKRRKRKKRR
jgi:hypothetical protein